MLAGLRDSLRDGVRDSMKDHSPTRSSGLHVAFELAERGEGDLLGAGDQLAGPGA